jgi:hypothetical protein
MDKPCRLLSDAQIEYDIIPQDVFTEPERYKTALGKSLTINTQQYRVLVVPYSQYVTKVFTEAIQILLAAGFPVIFIDGLPEAFCDIKPYDTETTANPAFAGAKILGLDTLIPYFRDTGVNEISISPLNIRIRYLHYTHDDGVSFYYLVNEGDAAWNGVIRFPLTQPCAVYNAWDNQLENPGVQRKGDNTEMAVEIEPLKSLIVVFDETLPPEKNDKPSIQSSVTVPDEGIDLDEGWTRSVCDALEYPQFSEAKTIRLPDNLAGEKPDFAGFIRYERSVTLAAEQSAAPRILEITDAYEGVELFVNGVSAGIQIAPPFRYRIDHLVKTGVNTVTVDVATTLERQVPPSGFAAAIETPKPKAPMGITGHVTLAVIKEESK